MDTQTLVNLGLVLLFVLVGGVFAGTEMALVSLRESQIDSFERQSRRGARVASVARDPNRFLSAVQIGVTVAGFLSAAYGASTLAPDFVPVLTGLGLPEAAAESAAVVVLTLLIAYLSLVLGELVPKRIAMQKPAEVALLVAPPLDRFATVMRPVIWLLSASTDAVVRLLRLDPHAVSQDVTGEELRYMVDQNSALEEQEKALLQDVFDAAERSLAEVMRPRGDVTALPWGGSVAEATRVVLAQPYSRFPVYGESIDDVRGFLHSRDLLGADPQAPFAALVREVPFLPSTNRVLPTMTWMRSHGAHLAVVVDEYGGTDGIVTLEDLVEELVGDIRDEYDEPHEPGHPEDDVDAGLSIEEFTQRTGVELADGPYETAAGFVIDRLGRLGEHGDVVVVGQHELVVSGVEGRRITRLDVRPVTTAPDPVTSADAEPGATA